jgi:DNA-binding GntR family transcriptional regulator
MRASYRAGAEDWIVLEHDADAIRQIYDLRIALEGYASRLAAERATERDLERVAAVYGDGIEELVELPRKRVVELNERFHEAIVGVCENPMLGAN